MLEELLWRISLTDSIKSQADSIREGGREIPKNLIS